MESVSDAFPPLNDHLPLLGRITMEGIQMLLFALGWPMLWCTDRVKVMADSLWALPNHHVIQH